MRFRLLAMVLFATVVNAAHTIPFRWTPGQIEIEVSVNGGAARWFVLDTGAEYSIVDRVLADALKLEREHRGARDFARGVDFRIGPAVLRDQEVMVFQLDNFRRQQRAIDGLIGYDFFAKYVVRIDYDERTLTLSDPRTFQPPKNAAVVPLARVGRQFAVPVAIDVAGRKTMRANVTIDTGAQAPLVLRHPFAARHGLTDDAAANDPLNSESVASGRLQFLQIRNATITFAKHAFPNETLRIYAHPSGAGGATDSDGLLGNEILRHFAVTLDYSRGRMYLEP